MKLRYSREARDQIRALPPSTKSAIRDLCETLQQNPYQGKPLQRELVGFWTARHQRYRLIYKPVVETSELQIYHVGLRETVYEDFGKKMS